jgi:hypothetical protein
MASFVQQLSNIRKQITFLRPKRKEKEMTNLDKDNKIVTKMPGAVFNMCHSQVTGSMFVTQPWSCRLMNTPPH